MTEQMGSAATPSGAVTPRPEARLGLLVKDPEWVFAHWELDTAHLARLRRELGERVVAVSALTLRVREPEGGTAQTLLLPRTERSSYVRVQPGATGLRLELGLTLPSGEFRKLAASEAVSLPLPAPSPEPARRVVSYAEARRSEPGEAFAVSPRPRSEAPVSVRAPAVGASDRLGPTRSSRSRE